MDAERSLESYLGKLLVTRGEKKRVYSTALCVRLGPLSQAEVAVRFVLISVSSDGPLYGFHDSTWFWSLVYNPAFHFMALSAVVDLSVVKAESIEYNHSLQAPGYCQ